LFNLGVLAQQSAEHRSAATYLERALALRPDDATSLYNLISVYLASGQARPALERADRLLALQGADSGLCLQVGELLSKYGHAAQALRFYEMAKRRDKGALAAGKVPGYFDRLLADASTQFQQDAKAVAELEALVKSSPNEAIHHFKLGLMLTKLGEFSRCFDLLTRAVTQFPHSPEIRLAYALACYFTGRNDLAEQAYLQLVRMQPQSDQSHFALGNFYADLGRLQEAAASFQRAIRKNPRNYLNHYMHGVALFRCQSYSDSAASLRMALKLNPTHADSNFWLGKIHLLHDERAKALQAFERTVELEPKHIGAHYQLALLYGRLGQKEKSQASLEIQRRLNTQLHKGIVALRMP
jgi:tetratricopeptide (TPR) repeat protein